jgi:hypothetical protein
LALGSWFKDFDFTKNKELTAKNKKGSGFSTRAFF